MSAKRRRTPFGMHHLTVVPRNADERSEGEDAAEDAAEDADPERA